jgi:guanosine-3',5'-bis(diphosphate) 3'-pyrophosphohydrolase
MESFQGLEKKLQTYLDPVHIAEIEAAYKTANQAHEGQLRRSGEPYITHPLAVAEILADMHMDHQSLMAALLHDVIEDTSVSKETIEERFGTTVADLVDGLSKLTQIKFESRKEEQAENFRKMMLAMTEDIRVILVKLADRLHNMRTLTVLQPEKRRRIAKETLEIYAPIANRLGMNDVRMEFEDLGFNALYPLRSRRIERAVIAARGNRKGMLEKIKASLMQCLKESNLEGEIIGREKHLYSIYSKMRTNRKPFSEIMDVYGYRILVSTVDECYRVLGAVHNLYPPLPGRIKDYIAIPKANGYQSLHTTLKGMNGLPIEIQIRTREMEAMANNGIASHWLYKSDEDKASKSFQKGDHASHQRARDWMKGLLEMQQNAGNSLEFIENVKVDLFPDEVYLFTPKGSILSMPSGSTPIDFAYTIHSDVGNSCVAVRIDQRYAPLNVKLVSGQTVEIITAPNSGPNPTWLDFVRTVKARTNIRNYLKHQKASESIDLGRRLLNKALAALSTKLKDIDESAIKEVLEQSGYDSLDQLFENIGLGNYLPAIIARRLCTSEEGEQKNEASGEKLSSLTIKGTEGMMVNFAKCCRPIPGEQIVGHMSSGKGIVIHQSECRNLMDVDKHPEKYLDLTWAKDVEGEFTVELILEVENNRGLIANLANIITQTDANIDSIFLDEKDATIGTVKVIISVSDRVHLARIMKKIRAVKQVNKLTRV